LEWNGKHNSHLMELATVETQLEEWLV